MTEQSRPSSASQASGPKETTAQNATLQSATAAKAVAGPLTVRDLIVLGSVLIIFVASLVPIVNTLAGSLNLWNTSGLFYIGIGVVLPLVVGGLFLARRMSPAAKVRIGSLSIDQFGSVVAAFATYFFFVGTVSNFGIAFLIGLIGSLLLLVSTVCAQWIPVLAADFTGRVEVPAPLAARDAVPAVKRPGSPKPVAAQMGAAQQNAGQQPYGQGAPVSGASAQYVPGQQGVAQQGGAQQSPGAQQGGWNGAPAASKHNQAGQIFTPAKENSAGAGAGAVAGFGAGAGVGASAAAGSAAATTQAATSSAAAATPSTGAAATAGTGASAGTAGAAAPATAASAESGSARSTPSGDQSAATHTAAQPSVQTPAAAQGNFGATSATAAKETEAKEVVATTLNPQVPEALKSEAVKPAAASENPFAPSANRESITATVNPSVAPVVAEPFWFAVDRPQNAIDEKTRQFAFKLVPGAWILALEDRGNSFLVQDSRGKTGLLLDLVGIERASDSQ